MISLDQVLLLQQKVESAVAKIAELNQAVAQKEAENAALRSKCVELTNALSAKTEQFSSFQTDQSKIEEGILKALERLNAVESTVLSVANATAAASATAVAAQTVQPQTTESPVAQPAPAEGAQPVTNEVQQVAEPKPPVAPDMTVEQATAEAQSDPLADEAGAETAFDDGLSITPDISFDDASPSPEQPDDSSQGQFDIF